MMSWVLITDNSEEYLEGLLLNVLQQMKEDENLIIVDNRSEDETVPIIVGLIGEDFMNEEKYKFYINSYKKTPKESRKVAEMVNTKDNIVFINRKSISKNYMKRKRSEMNVTI